MDGVYWYQAQELARSLSEEALLAAGIDAVIVERFTAARYVEQQREILPAVPSPGPSTTTTATLRELLGRRGDRRDRELLGRYRALAPQAAEFSGAAREVLAEAIEPWRPDGSYADTIEWLGEGQWREQRRPAAWLAYSSALGLRLTAAEWAALPRPGRSSAPIKPGCARSPTPTVRTVPRSF